MVFLVGPVVGAPFHSAAGTATNWPMAELPLEAIKVREDPTYRVKLYSQMN